MVVRIEGILADLVQPADYVHWEYLSRQRLLATQIASFRDHAPARVLGIGCGNGALSLTLSEAAGFDLVAVDILAVRTSAVQARQRGRESRRPSTSSSRKRRGASLSGTRRSMQWSRRRSWNTSTIRSACSVKSIGSCDPEAASS